MQSLHTDDELTLKATPAKVWEALTNPELTKQYMYTCEVICDWNIGDPILWKGSADGVIYVKGYLVAFDQEKLFSYTVIDPLGKYEDIPENYLTVTCTLTEIEDGTKLRVTQGDYAGVADGEERYKHATAGGGWGGVLELIQKLVE